MNPIHLALVIYFATVGSFNLKVRPIVVMAGNNMHIMCQVPRNINNRWVEWGLENFKNSGRALDGIHSRVTYEAYYDRVPCGSGPAYCAVTDHLDKVMRITIPIEIVGCEP